MRTLFIALIAVGLASAGCGETGQPMQTAPAGPMQKEYESKAYQNQSETTVPAPARRVREALDVVLQEMDYTVLHEEPGKTDCVLYVRSTQGPQFQIRYRIINGQNTGLTVCNTTTDSGDLHVTLTQKIIDQVKKGS